MNPELEQAMARVYAVPPHVLGPEPSMETVRQRADVITAYAEAFRIDPLITANHDPTARAVIFRDRLMQMGFGPHAGDRPRDAARSLGG